MGKFRYRKTRLAVFLTRPSAATNVAEFARIRAMPLAPEFWRIRLPRCARIARILWAKTLIATLLAACTSLGAETPSTKVDFHRTVRPILTAKCFACHGPDEDKRQADLRLDQQESVVADRGGYAVIVPGRPADSALYQRITTHDDGERMPPADSGKQLTAAEIELLRRWIEQGGKYEPHWAFVAPRRPPLPAVRTTGWPRGPMDRFVLARLESSGLVPSAEANPCTLARRVYFDLIGLPPRPDETSTFLDDVQQTSLDAAYERLVERLLASPHYGQRWARPWLDLARYADTNGYEKDRSREIWAFRDWVIQAINDDMPFDQFTIEQIGGDLLPNAGLAQKIATGFHRNTMLNEEGGIDPLEFRFYAISDRVAVTGTTWLGLTLHCCQCHSHKYDPISQREYYQLMAFLNNADEPELDLPSPDVDTQYRHNLDRANELLAQLSQKFPLPDAEPPADARSIRPIGPIGPITPLPHSDPPAAGAETLEARRTAHLEQRFSAWLAERRGRSAAWTSLRPIEASSNMPILTVEEDDSVFVSGDTTKHDVYHLRFRPQVQSITAFRLEALPDDRLPGHGPGLTYYEGTKGDFFLSEFQGTADGQPLKFSGSTYSFAANQFGEKSVSAQLVTDGDLQSGWSVFERPGERHVTVFVLEKPIDQVQELVLSMHFGRHFASSLGRFRVSVTTAPKPEALDLPADVEALLLKPDAELSTAERTRLREEFLLVAPETAKDAAEIRKLRRQPAPPTTLVLRERPIDKPRPTHLHARGEFLRPTDEVFPATPVALHSYSSDLPRNRLGLAQWLVAPENPLTARVVVNRQWAALCGAGIVRTTDDFGVQGAAPINPELLDWLAVEFVHRSWSLKGLHRQIVTSATYRQSSRLTPELLARDPANELLGRMSRRRLDAEMIRDAALQAADLLSSKMGGPGVRPPQPAGVTEVAFGSPEWQPSAGVDRQRRSIFTTAKRTAPFAAYQIFDAPSGETCTARRDASNTPLQALTLLNDVMFAEAAQVLGTMLAEREGDDLARTTEAFGRVMTRAPDEQEAKYLTEFVAAQRRRFTAGELVARVTAGDERGNVIERATWTTLARALLNLDEAINRN